MRRLRVLRRQRSGWLSLESFASVGPPKNKSVLVCYTASSSGSISDSGFLSLSEIPKRWNRGGFPRTTKSKIIGLRAGFPEPPFVYGRE